jgi:hypothetical protein
MGAEYKVDRGGVDAGPPQPIEEAGVTPLMPGRNLRTILAFADTAIDQDRPPLRAKNEALNREPRLVARAQEKLWLQYAALRFDYKRIEPNKELRKRKMEVVVIHDDIDDRVPDRKSHGGLLLQ